MPRVKSYRGRKLTAQPPLAPTLVTAKRHRRPNGYGPNQPVSTFSMALPVDGLDLERAQDLLKAYRRELAQCNEGACECCCHCHSGSWTCALAREGELPHGFHFRKPNTAHKRAHRECFGHTHNRK